MNKLVKRLLTGTLAFATILTALPVTAVHASGNQYWTESAERVGYIEHVMNDGSIKSTFNPVTLQTISKVLRTMILHSFCSQTVRWKMQSVWITSSTSYRLQIWFCRIRILPLRNTRPLNCCRYPS